MGAIGGGGCLGSVGGGRGRLAAVGYHHCHHLGAIGAVVDSPTKSDQTLSLSS